ncbi:MAG: RNA polymerase sigma factor, partial [Planctomycetota bacterium]
MPSESSDLPAANGSADPRTDEQLLGDYRTGDSPALRVLIERHQADLLRFLTRLLGSRAAAEDAFQDTFLQIHISADTFDTSRRFRPWLFTIAANKARDQLRKNSRQRAVTLSAPVGAAGSDRTQSFVDLLEIDVPSPDAALDQEELSRQVQAAIDKLSPTLREILLLAYFQKLSYAQIADDLDIPLGTVK